MSRPYVFISELPALNSLECYTATAEYRGNQELQEKCRFARPVRVVLQALCHGKRYNIYRIYSYFRELTRGDSAILISPVTEDVHFRAATLRTAATSTPRNQWNVVLIAKVRATSAWLYNYNAVCDGCCGCTMHIADRIALQQVHANVSSLVYRIWEMLYIPMTISSHAYS